MRDSDPPFDIHGHRHCLHAASRRALTADRPSARGPSALEGSDRRHTLPAITSPIVRLTSTLSKAFRFAPTPFGAYGLDRLSVEPRDGTYVMAGLRLGLEFEGIR
jgi:hypothetical protein